MVQFNRHGQTGLYISDRNPNHGGWWGLVIPQALEQMPDGPIPLSIALQNDTWRGVLVYAATHSADIAANAEAFIDAINRMLGERNVFGAIVFLASGAVEDIKPRGNYCIPLLRLGEKIMPRSGFTASLTGSENGPGVCAEFDSRVELTVPAGEDHILLTPTEHSEGPAVRLGGREEPLQTTPPTGSATLWFEGTASGAFTFPLLIDQHSLTTHLNMGFQVVIPRAVATGEDSSDLPRYESAFLPLADQVRSRLNWIGFNARINIQNPHNLVDGASETALLFSGKNGPYSKVCETVFDSAYRSNYGDVIVLTPLVEDGQGQVPARLVINTACCSTPTQNAFRFAPAGDFAMSIPGGTAAPPARLLCGLSGTETIAFLPASPGCQDGERLRFVPNMPANVPQFPLPPASPVGPPIDPDAGLLDDVFRTSWTAFVAPPGDADRRAHYAAAPRGAELFGASSSGVNGYLAPEDPGVGLAPDGSVVFPLLPVSGFKPRDFVGDINARLLQLLDRQIISPTRKQVIASSMSVARASTATASLAPRIGAAAGDDQLVNTTTPTGFVTRYARESGAWQQLLLAQVEATADSPGRQMGFVELSDELTAAFQTPDQFLVVANRQYLGKPAPAGTFMPPLGDTTSPGQFFNCINIGKWNFEVQTGQRNAYGDYRSVMLVKGVKGPILGVDSLTGKASSDSLVLNPDKWTMKNQFGAPSSGDSDADVSQLVILSRWMLDYCQDAYDKGIRDNNPYFANFARIITDPDWTGVLILKAAIADVPAELAGILAGVSNPSDFFAHHIGIEVSQIDGTTVQVRDTTSMFGLVYYVDPRYDDGEPAHTIPAGDAGAGQEFTLLTLKALFRNSAVKTFESLAQMVLNTLFGSRVATMVDIKDGGRASNPDKAVLLEGGVQKNGDAVVYSLASKWPNQISLSNNVLRSVEIDSAQMSTRDDGRASGTVVSWIAMSGYMNFDEIPAPPLQVKERSAQPPMPVIDLFSFGPDKGDEHRLRQGLNFYNLGLQITVDVQPPEDTGPPPDPTVRMMESAIAFNTDPVASHYRDQSLYKGFQLELQGLLSGDANAEGEQKSTPAGLGFASVITEYQLRDVASGAGKWHALKFKLNLGTPGKLAGDVNLNSSLLLAWADDSGAGGPAPGQERADTLAMVGIELPGAGAGAELFSLQTVIKLSIGLIQLTYTPPGRDGNPGGFLLVLNQIALKLLGLLKIPPSGNTAFLLFGNPKADDPTGLGWFAMYNKELPANNKELPGNNKELPGNGETEEEGGQHG